MEGKPIQLTIGDYPSISLSQAREGRQQYSLLITEGLDPRQLVAPDRIKN
nr:Arm DNA-binding domain-containing protein [Pantoea dispersa]